MSFDGEEMDMEMENETLERDLSIYKHPSLSEYYTHLTPFITLSIFVSLLLLLLNISIYCTTLHRLRKRLDRPLLRPTIVLCTFYPLVAVAALVTILLPKAWLVCHTWMHLSFTVGAVIFQRLCFHYVDSEVSFLKETDGTAVAINTPPCCCCCMCLPALVPSRSKLCLLRYMILQMPFVQGSVMLVLNVIYYRERELYENTFSYFIPFIIGSILIGVWALNITVRMITKFNPEFRLLKKMFALQLILLLCKLQYLVLDSQMNSLRLGGPYPINHTIYKQTIINLLILAEMVLVSLLAQSAYTNTNTSQMASDGVIVEKSLMEPAGRV